MQRRTQGVLSPLPVELTRYWNIERHLKVHHKSRFSVASFELLVVAVFTAPPADPRKAWPIRGIQEAGWRTRH